MFNVYTIMFGLDVLKDENMSQQRSHTKEGGNEGLQDRFKEEHFVFFSSLRGAICNPGLCAVPCRVVPH